MLPLSGMTVLDFSTLLPGPLASLFLAEAGARVVKVERPGEGDVMRTFGPAEFDMLNAGKDSVAIDLKETGAIERLRPLIEGADVLLEQFRPGTMDRLGLGYEAVRAIRSDIIYCSLNGYGSKGEYASVPGHDLTYAAESGLLGLTTGSDGAPVVPWALVADVGGGTYPLLVNLLMALLRRSRTGEGCQIEVAMFDGLYAFAGWTLAAKAETGNWPVPNGNPASGSSPRYHIYETSDRRHLAVACVEQKFWHNFCLLISLPDDLAASDDHDAVVAAVAEQIAQRSSAEWTAIFKGREVCCAVVRTPAEAMEGALVRDRGLVSPEGILPLPLSPALRRADRRPAPALGQSNPLLAAVKPRI
ncbi:CaiB/BaiF CoA transferase family protein [Oryzicola mucosus]|uniref:CoA transferase n=1 Tax=Oryzicola mucosus TaxID=2767425 RepID=A0A8J6U3U8_9HYPH|nr:CaiB/BaiF CoA-transferase family protein [Oryzicola mucosus]MBD0417373.1 CoA transferase [Oryzicola mucosus]